MQIQFLIHSVLSSASHSAFTLMHGTCFHNTMQLSWVNKIKLQTFQMFKAMAGNNLQAFSIEVFNNYVCRCAQPLY